MSALADIGGWGFRRYMVAVAAAVAWLVAAGVPTDRIDTPLFVRMTPAEWWNYSFWAAVAVLVGLLVATYIAPPGRVPASGSQGKLLGGGVLSVFAVGCPVCNKLVGLLGYALRVRLSRENPCPAEISSVEETGGQS